MVNEPNSTIAPLVVEFAIDCLVLMVQTKLRLFAIIMVNYSIGIKNI